MQENDYKKRISAHDFAVVGKDIYFFSLNYNGLYCLHMPQRQLEFLGSAPCEEFQKRHLYGAIIEVDGKLYMPPMTGEEIAVYDIKQKKFDKIALRYEYRNIGSKFFGALYDNKKIFFIPCWYHYLVVLNLDSGQITYLDEWRHMLHIPEEYAGLLIRNGFYIKDKVLYLASMVDNSIITISTENYETKIMKIGNDNNGFIDICFDEQEKCIWLLKKNKPVVERWDLESYKTKVYEVVLDSYEQLGEYPFINLVCDQNRIYLVSFQSNISVIMNKTDAKFFPAEWDTDDINDIHTEWGAKNYFAKKLEENMFVLGTIGELSFCIIKQGIMIDKIYLNDPLLLYRYNCQKGIVIREDEEFDILDFLEIIFTMQQKADNKYNLKLPCGQKIYQMLTKTMDEREEEYAK